MINWGKCSIRQGYNNAQIWQDSFDSYFQSPSGFQEKDIIWLKYLAGFKAPPVASNRQPQLIILSWRAACDSTIDSDLLRSRCSKLGSSANNVPAKWMDLLDIGHQRWTPWPFCLCAWIIAMLSTIHPAGAAPLLWHKTWVYISPVALAKSLESPKSRMKKKKHILYSPKDRNASLFRYSEGLEG